MLEARTEDAIVVCICGALAAGKTTLVRGLSERLDGAAVLVFDEYAAHCEWPQDLDQWTANGCDPSAVRNARLMQDLALLRSGKDVVHPVDEHPIVASPIILLEDPFGRMRPDNADLIDLVLFVDLPWDLSVVRMAQRALGLADLPERDMLGDEAVDDLYARIDLARIWLSSYALRREMYTSLSAPVRRSSDAILDGMKQPAAVLEDALAVIRQETGRFETIGV